MWIATTFGWVSIVRPDEDNWYVRARDRRTLEVLGDIAGITSRVHDWPTADYRFRLIVNRAELTNVLLALGARIDYPNFKTAAMKKKGARYAGVLSKVWSTMLDFYNTGRYARPLTARGWSARDTVPVRSEDDYDEAADLLF